MNLNTNKATSKRGRTKSETLARHSLMDCKVIKVKVDESKLSTLQAERLKMSFVQAKWLYNYIIAQPDGLAINVCQLKKVPHFDKDGREVVSDLTLHSTYRQSVQEGLKSAVKALKTLKANGHKVGRFKFISEYTSLDIPQFGKDQNGNCSIRSDRTVKVPGIRKPVKVRGLVQLRAFRHYEVANAKLLLKPDGYYIAITVFVDRAAAQPAQMNGKSLGIDFGCSTSFTTSEGERISVRVEETERLRRLQRKLARQQRRSNNRLKTRRGIKREYQKLNNRKFDATNQLVAKLRRYEHIVIQDEALAEWQATGHGRAVQHSILGRVKARLQNLPNVTVISRYLPTSKFCPHCGHTHEALTLRDRVFKCPICGHMEDRDVHAAKNMLHFFKSQQVPREPRDVKPVEIRPSGCGAVPATSPKAESVKQEADCP